MAKLSGAEKVQRGKELNPVRLMAFKLWQENPQITLTELDQALKENGFEIVRTTRATWLRRFRQGSGVRTFHKITSRKLSPARRLAFKLWEQNPQITGAQLFRALQEQGLNAKRNIYNWLEDFKKDKGIVTSEQKVIAVVEGIELTLEQIIKAAGSVETLSVLFYQGVMREMARKDAAYHLLKQECINKDNRISALKHSLDDVTRERNQIMRDFNEKLAKVRVGTLTLDETTRRLIPKK